MPKHIVISRKLGQETDVDLGGPGSGHWAHRGRPGQRGGSLPRGAGMTIAKGRDWLQRYKAKTGRDHPYKAVADQWREELAATRKIVERNKGARTAAEVRKVFDEISAAYEAKTAPITQRIDALSDRRHALWEERKGATSREERRALAEEADRLSDELIDLKRQMQQHTAQMNAELRKLLYVDDPIEVGIVWGSRFGKDDPRRKAIYEGVEELEKMVSVQPNLRDSVTISKGGRGRSNANADGSGINLSPYADTPTVIHELGHWLEDNSSPIQARVYAFYEQRTAGEPTISMNRAQGTRGYAAHEVTKVDRFLHPYMGKDYSVFGRRYATEILSMGLEMFYSDPRKLAREDPEYFDFIYAVVRGME